MTSSTVFSVLELLAAGLTLNGSVGRVTYPISAATPPTDRQVRTNASSWFLPDRLAAALLGIDGMPKADNDMSVCPSAVADFAFSTASNRAFASANRSAGSLFIIRPIRPHTAFGKSGRRSASGSAWSCRCWAATAIAVSPRNGARPANMW